MALPGIETGSRGTGRELALTVVFREIREGDASYFVAECLEIPGGVSQGTTREEAHANIHDATESCLSVIFEDTVKQLMDRQGLPDLRGICSQERLRFHATPCLEFEHV